MIAVKPLRDETENIFSQLFSNYYKELGCDEDAPHLVDEYILPDLLAGLINIDIIADGDIYAGFIIYQKDDIDNDWNYKENWGDIREIYVIPSLRGQGLGKFMLLTAEMKLKERGLDKAYSLPNQKSEEFFIKCGYKKTEVFNEDTECYVFEKRVLNPGCKHDL